jgi:hypothetical protein
LSEAKAERHDDGHEENAMDCTGCVVETGPSEGVPEDAGSNHDSDPHASRKFASDSEVGQRTEQGGNARGDRDSRYEQ